MSQETKLLDLDVELIKELGLVDVPELSKNEASPLADSKYNFVISQLESLKKQAWRTRVDIILNRNITTDGEKEREAVEAKIKEHTADLKRTSEVISILDRLAKELQD